MTSQTLDPNFSPFIRSITLKPEGSVPVCVSLFGEEGRIKSFVIDVKQGEEARLCRVIKFLLWAWGAWRIEIRGPEWAVDAVSQTYCSGGARSFDVALMESTYGRPFEVVGAAGQPPADNVSAAVTAGGHLNGARIGFDLGASDYKVAAVLDGEVLFSGEFPWDPKSQTDPEYHWNHLNAGIQAAAKHLPRVDAIGGSSAGIIVGNEIRVASLIRGIPEGKPLDHARRIFQRLQGEWGVPVQVANDGDVTALAGAMSLGVTGVLGIAMGSSEAAGYVDRSGCVSGFLNELAFAPVDESPDAAVDEWSGDSGVGALYFSQQATNKLLAPAGISVPAEMSLPKRLEHLQALIEQDVPGAKRIYETIGEYLGHTLPLYARFYDFDHVLILGRVTTGRGGDIIMRVAREVLDREYPDIAQTFAVHVPDEKMRRVGQAVAAASLPTLS